MAFDVSLLVAYTDETSQALVAEALTGAKTVGLVTVLPNIKNKTALNILDSTLAVQADACGWNSSGTVAFKQRDIEVFAAKTNQSLCPKTLEQYWLGQIMKAGSATDIPFQSFLDSYISKQIAAYIETDIWMGQTIGSPSVGNISGYLELLAQSTDIVYVSAAAPTHSASNIIAHVDAMVTAIPEEIMMFPDLTLFMSPADYKMYTAALRTANLFWYDGKDQVNFETYIPGTNVKAVATPGLSTSHNWVLTYASNLVFGTDLAGEETKIQSWYSQDNQEIRVLATWKYGVQVYFPQFCVTNFDHE